MATNISAGMKLQEARSLSLRHWGRGWQVHELSEGGDRRLLRGAEKRRMLRVLGATYRHGECDPWPGQPWPSSISDA